MNMDKCNFYNKLYTKIMSAMKICDEGNVIDMRLYGNSKCVCEGIYSIFEVDALYEEIKKHKEWFIDFYENIKDANTAEFMDIALFSGDFGEDNVFPWKITEIEQDLARNLLKEDVKANVENNTMYEEINKIVNDFNKEFGERTFNEILGCAKSNIDGLFLVRDVDDFNNNEIACEVEYKGLNFKAELVNGGICISFQMTPETQWEMAKANAICLWDTLNDSCFVEITPKYVKFFKSENGNFFACYEYPPLAELKKDMTFINEVEECMAESNMLTEQMQADLKTWRMNDCDLPPFPISVILHSEYQNYKFTEWE